MASSLFITTVDWENFMLIKYHGINIQGVLIL